MKKTFKTALALLFCIVTISATMLSASALGKPTLKVKSVTYNSVTIYWTAVSGADYYQIQRTTDGKNWTTLSSNYAKTTATDSKGLTTGKAYGYRVRAVDKGLLGRLTYSAWTSMVTAKPVPAKVTGFKVKASNNTTVQLTWTKVAGANGYTVQYLSGSKWKTYKSTTSNVLNVTGLTLGKTYTFRVAAYRTVSKKAVYGPVSASLKAGPTLKAPTTVALTAVTQNSLTIQWNASAGAKGYELGDLTTRKWTNTGTTKGMVVKNLKPGTKYKFVVRAYSGSFKGTMTKEYTFQTAPATPTGLKITNATDNSMTFSWNKVAGAAGYVPQIYDYATNKWSYLATTTTATSITAKNLKSNTKYAFRVCAYVKNSNVYKISASAYSSWAKYITYTTVLSAPKVTTAATSENTITLNWNAVSGAKSYMVERFDATHDKWFVYDFNSAQFKAPDALSASSVTTTTARTFADKGGSARTELYRVSAIDAAGKKCTPAEICGRTSNTYVNAGAATFSLQQVIRFPKVAGATLYRIYTRYPINAEVYVDLDVNKDKTLIYTYTGNTNFMEAKIHMAPKSIHSIMVIALDANGKTISNATNWMTFKVGDLAIYANSHNYYNSSVNSQLLYLARAINNTKLYKGELTVKNTSNVSYSINYLKMPAILSILIGGPVNGVCDTPEEVANLFSKLGDGEEVETSSTENYNETLTFKDGSTKNAEDKTVYLKYYIEPSSNSTRSASIYNSKTFTAWTKGFENVKTTKNSDGGYTITCTIKQETSNTNYHNGLLSSFNAADFSAAEGFSVNNLKVGKSTITATIDADGILKSYKASSPYSATFVAGFTAEEDSDDGNIQEGDLIEMTMGMSGSTAFNYTFTR